MKAVVRRRPTPQQGRSLEMLGHAIEYLIDSELSDGTPFSHACPSEAAQILMRLNREVFAECKQIVPLPVRIRQQIARLIERKNQPVQVPSAAAPRT